MVRLIDKESQESLLSTSKLAREQDEEQPFDIDEMLKDDSEDEEEQKNFEMETYLTDWVTVNEAHGYRGEMRHKIEQDSRLSAKERSHLEQMNR